MDNCEPVQDPKLQTILQLLEIGDVATAKQKCRSILSQEASNPSILFLLGLIAEKEGEFEIAVRYLRKSIVVNPHNLQVYNLLMYTSTYEDLDKNLKCYYILLNENIIYWRCCWEKC